MPNYKETEITGVSWTRVHEAKIVNQYEKTPYISFNEEEVFKIGDEVLHRSSMETMTPNLVVKMTNPEATFDLLDPTTDEVIGTATHAQVHAMIYSLYRSAAAQRDSAKVSSDPAPAIPVVPVITSEPSNAGEK